MAKKGNQELENWLVGLSNPRLNIQFIEVNVRDKRVVILEIPMASVKPTAFAGDEYIRIGSYKKKLKDFPEKERTICYYQYGGIAVCEGFEQIFTFKKKSCSSDSV